MTPRARQPVPAPHAYSFVFTTARPGDENEHTYRVTIDATDPRMPREGSRRRLTRDPSDARYYKAQSMALAAMSAHERETMERVTYWHVEII